MKILYISGMYPNPTYPQKGIFCHEQVKALKKLGVDVDVLVPMTLYDKEFTTRIWEYEGVVIQYLRYFKYPGVRFFEYIGNWLYLSLLFSGINFKQYDILHADATLPAGDAVRKLSKKCGIPYVVHGHGLDVFMDVDYAGAPNCQNITNKCIKVYQEAQGIVGVSKKVIDNINKRLELQQKCYIVYNGVDVTRFYPSEYKKGTRIEIVSIGNLIDLKGHDLTIQAISKLVHEDHMDLHLDIYGRGEKSEELQVLVRKLGIGEYVSFKGYVPYEQVADVLRTYDMFILPSWYEAIGCVYLEAMASGLITVGCHDNGIDEIIENGVNGYLVHPHESDEIAEIIRTVYDKRLDDDMKQLVVEGRKTVVNDFTWMNSAQRLKQVYNTLLE